MEKRQINLKKKDLKSIMILLFVPLLLTFVIEHFGNFRFHANSNGQNLPVNQISILIIYFDTPFGNQILTDGNEFTYNDTVFENGKFHSYLNKLPYYIKGFISDIIYPLIFSFILIGFYFLNKKFRFKLIDENQV